MPRAVSLSLLLLSVAVSARADKCADVLARIGPVLADATCVASSDLTTNNPATTPGNNSILGLPGGAFTPVTDRGVISPTVHTAITHAVPGVQLNARIADDPTKEARFLLRLPDDWNGRLVVAGASGTRSEFNGDWAWSDYVVQKGYAYASQNKGILNLKIAAVTDSPNVHVDDPLACRIQAGPKVWLWVHFYDNDPEKPFTEWQFRIAEAAAIAKEGVKGRYGHFPRYTYAVGTSNGGYQVRRAVEEAPGLFDGGVDWEGTFVDSSANNILATLPPAIKNFPAYVASGFDPGSSAAQAIVAAGYPPDIVNRDPATGKVITSLWAKYSAAFWEVTQCQWQKRLDPTYDTYGPNFTGAGDYNYAAQTETTEVEENLEAFATTGKIKRPLITVAGTMDGLLPIKHQARAYANKVAESREDDDEEEHAQYRLYEVQNGNHIETYKDTFPQLELTQPHAQRAFDLLVDHVEKRAELPPDQCIGRGGVISESPARDGRCQKLFVP
jgi:hypothetical protein